MPTVVRNVCEQCHGVFRRPTAQRFCSRTCSVRWRRANVEARRKLFKDRHLDSETFVVGLVDRPTHCPHPGCGAPLAYEPGFAHCAAGCGRLWPLRGASVAAQRTYELGSGLSQ